MVRVIGDKAMLCPLCGKELIKGYKNIYCSNYMNGCKLSIPYYICGKKLNTNQIAMLINSQRTNVISDLISKSGNNFDASLQLNKQGKIIYKCHNINKIKHIGKYRNLNYPLLFSIITNVTI